MSQAAKIERPRVAHVESAAPGLPLVQRPPYVLALAAALGVFALYAITLAPSTAFWDTSEYISTAHILGIPHPPGNPLFVLLSRAWELVLAPTGLATAVRINLFSAFMSAGTAFFWYLMVHRILGYMEPRENVRRIGAGVSVLLSATAYTVWNQSNVNEKVYTVSLFTIAALSWLAFLWRDHVEQHQALRGEGARRLHDDNVLLLMVFMLALSVGNHLMAFLAAPALVVFVLLVKPRALLSWRLYALALVFGFLGLSVHLFLAIRSGLHPVINEAQPSCPTLGSAIVSVLGMGKVHLPGECQDLYASLAREQYGKPSVFDRQAPFWAQMATYLQYFDWQWSRAVSGASGYFGPGRVFITVLFTALGGYGAWEHYKRDRKSAIYVGLLFFTLSVGLVYYMNFKWGFGQVRALGMSPELSEVRERDYFFLVSFSLWGLWSGIGLTMLWTGLADALEGRGRTLALAAPVLLLGLVPLALNWKYASRRGDYAARDFAYNLLQSVEPYGVLFTNGDNDTFPLWYLQEAEGVRRDVTVIVLSYLNTPWYPRQLRDLTKPCAAGQNPLSDPTRIVCQRPYQGQKETPFYGTPKAPTRDIFGYTDEQIDAIAGSNVVQVPSDMVFSARDVQVPIQAGKYLQPADQFVLSIIKQAWGDRPIFFASTTNVQYDLGLYPFVARQGLAFKLVTPAEGARLQKMPTGSDYNPILGAYMDLAMGERLFDHTFITRDLGKRPHWTDDATRNIPIHYFYGYAAQSVAEEMRGDKARAARYIAAGNEFKGLSER